MLELILPSTLQSWLRLSSWKSLSYARSNPFWRGLKIHTVCGLTFLRLTQHELGTTWPVPQVLITFCPRAATSQHAPCGRAGG